MPLQEKNNCLDIGEKSKLINYLYEKYLSYSQQAFDNLVLGNYKLYRAGLRILVENYIVIHGIISGDDSVWERYLIQSTLDVINLVPQDEREDNYKESIHYMKQAIDNLKKEFNLLDRKIEERKFNYDWLSTKDKKITSFKQACDQLEPSVYKDFCLLSNFSHSNSISYKIVSDHYLIISSIQLHCIYLTKIINLLNLDISDNYKELNLQFWECSEELIELLD